MVGSFEQCSSYSSSQSGLKRRLSERARLRPTTSPLYPDSCDKCDSWSPTFRGSPQANTTTSQPVAIRPRITPIEQMVGSFEQCSSYSSGQSGLKRRLSERARLRPTTSPLYPDSCDSCDSWSPTFRGSPQANTTTSQPVAIRPRITPIEQMVGSFEQCSSYSSGQSGLKRRLSERAQLPSSASPSIRIRAIRAIRGPPPSVVHLRRTLPRASQQRFDHESLQSNKWSVRSNNVRPTRPARAV
jgi:hypothetical protein